MLTTQVITYSNCCRCPLPVGDDGGSIEVYVDVPPPASDVSDYAIFMRGVWAKHPKSWVRLPFCAAHLKEQIERGEVEFEDERLWQADHPSAFIAEPKVIRNNGKVQTH